MEILNSTLDDIDTIYQIYDSAVAYQKANFHRHWYTFSRQILEAEINEKRHWKMIEGDTTGCIFSVTYTDPYIWFEKDNDVSIYIHRIAVNGQARGAGFVPHIIAWAKQHAKNTGKKYIRIDTFCDNTKLIDYYLKCGFEYVGVVKPEITADSPPHYVGIELGLFEIVVE
jgi:ribosomal protein S18 acetylase RimI-like enzyme